MVKIVSVRESNAHFSKESNEGGLVCVFAGATSGIGASTIERMATMLHSPTFYVIGRSASRFASQRMKLESLNTKAKVVFLKAEISLLSEVDRVCKLIMAAEKKVDYLYMSPGLMPLNGPEYTKEGLDTCFTTSYYSRVRLASKLLPRLRESSRPVVLSVLVAGKEKPLLETDLGLEHNWSFTGVVNHTITMTSLVFNRLSQEESNKNITFLHSAPGLVKTDIFNRLTPPDGSSLMWRTLLPVIQGLAGMLYWILGISAEESGEKQAFLLTSERFRPGAWRIDPECEIIPTDVNGVVEKYIESGWGEKIWEHTVAVFEKASSLE